MWQGRYGLFVRTIHRRCDCLPWLTLLLWLPIRATNMTVLPEEIRDLAHVVSLSSFPRSAQSAFGSSAGRASSAFIHSRSGSFGNTRTYERASSAGAAGLSGDNDAGWGVPDDGEDAFSSPPALVPRHSAFSTASSHIRHAQTSVLHSTRKSGKLSTPVKLTLSRNQLKVLPCALFGELRNNLEVLILSKSLHSDPM